MRSLLFVLFFPTLVFAQAYTGDFKLEKEDSSTVECKVTYPTADTAVRDGKTYHLKKASPIYQKLEEAR